MKKRKFYVINAFISMLFIGVPFTWSVFMVPLETAYHWSRSATSLAFTIELIFFSAGCILSGLLSSKLKPATLIKISAISMGLGFFLSGFVSQAALIYFTYSLLCGLGCGCGYNTILAVVPSWYPEKSGTITGILLVGYALTGAILGPLITMMITAVGIAGALYVVGVSVFIVIFLSSFNIKIPTFKETKELPSGPLHNEESTRNTITSEMLHKPIFYLFFLGVVLIGGSGSALISHVSPIMQEDFKASASIATLIISMNSICNGAGRIVSGMLYDKFKLKVALTTDVILALLGSALLVGGIWCHQIFIFILGSAITMLAFGADASNIPTTIRTLFGTRTLSLNLSVMNLNAFPASFITTIVGLLQNKTGDYKIPILMMFLFFITGSVLFLLVTRIYHKDYE